VAVAGGAHKAVAIRRALILLLFGATIGENPRIHIQPSV
jgi:hypothetical protein